MAFDEERKKCAGIFGGGTFVLILSIAMIAIGAYHVDWKSNDPLNNNDCSVQPHIPNFLMAGGIIFILGMVLRVIFMRCCVCCGDICNNSLCNSVNFGFTFTCILIYDILILILYVVWLCYGSHWTFDVYDQQTDQNCPNFLYFFTFALVIFLWFMFLMALTCGILARFCQCCWDILCCRPCERRNPA
ncbi:hypothetical protein TCAL_12820 [Tigriopus californicus]|uniref:Uncharacterized protein n=1 Tax=Tigriopus californicus TaxID=6832 RepID=A0A553PJ99_TIGCA|nr:uncharacterized protein LOC131891003 [Tigriopus californicus]XP_059096461.1 uncharacterized protein LOC131891003 [Tigriopus californicus]XP_059096462.1 uncharacterized protein LOC131891003 [Tigriopus californicus]TRY77765.1 hypothetical protein TCAL_12820 [Tigriopus californicus]|eukprot:TCALIF_12820-PA protein Name:"Protein of unknown function" AED:0.34 eAED:0.34 QI:375/1/1/1/0.66/0.5/4/218/187